MAEQQTSTQSDDVSVPSGDEDVQISDILARSPLAQAAGIVPTPEFEEDEESLPEAEADPAEEFEDEQDLSSEDEAATNEIDDVDEEDISEEEDGYSADVEDDESTFNDVFDVNELEDIMVSHKVDGEEITQPLSEWIASSATKQHLSQQGREIGEQKKALEEERNQKLRQIDQIGKALSATLYGNEMKAQREYNELSQKIAKAEESDDTYEIGELSKKRNQKQKEYWEARNGREAISKGVQEQQTAAQQNAFQNSVKRFQEEIPNVIPDWDDNVAKEVREFAIEEGLPEALVNVITDPALVKFVYDYKNLKNGVSRGAEKRKVTKKLKTPAKRSRPANKVQMDREAMVKARAFKQDSSKEDQDAFMKQYALKSLGG